jgi:hypothetical protein
MAPPGPTEEPALAWLDSGLYKLLFNVSVRQAVVDAEDKLIKASDAHSSCKPTSAALSLCAAAALQALFMCSPTLNKT